MLGRCISPFSFSVNPDFHLLGCFINNASDPAIATIEGTDAILDGSSSTRRHAIEKCARVAWTEGYQVFGVENGACHTSASAHSTYNKHGQATSCTQLGVMRVYNFTGMIVHVTFAVLVK